MKALVEAVSIYLRMCGGGPSSGRLEKDKCGTRLKNKKEEGCGMIG